MKPQFLNVTELPKLKHDHPELILDDQIELALDELFDISYPAQKDSKSPSDVEQFGRQLTGGNSDDWGQWVYYPWLNRLVHFPPQAEFRQLRTSRNRNLITAAEQSKLYEATILIIGMSVGSNVVEAVVAQGIGSRLVLVDMDIIEPSNLNRIRSPYYHVGLHKVDAISRKVWEIDPFMEIVECLNGINQDNLEQILDDHQPAVVIDEMDQLRMKILLREAAKRRHLPVVMAADDGDNALVDIERHDLEAEAPIFNGLIPNEVLHKIKTEDLSRPEIGLMIGKYFVGFENTPLRMFQSLSEVGKSLPSWPQLGGAAALSGVVLAYVARKIILGEKIVSGRVLVSLDDKIDLEHHNDRHKDELAKFVRAMGG